MPNPPVQLSRRALALRAAGFAVAVALGGVGVWLIVTGNSEKSIRLGALSALWGLLLGTFAMFGSRRGEHEVAEAAAPSASLARVDDSEAQAAYLAQLEAMLRREIQTNMAREVAGLRAEISSLRTELLEKVGAQVQLERIETTRLIGSDLEALQREVRQLRSGSVFAAPAPPVIETVVETVVETVAETPPRPNGVRPTPHSADSTDIYEAEVVDDDQPIYRGRRRRDDEDEAATRPRPGGRDSPEGAELLARLLSRQRD